MTAFEWLLLSTVCYLTVGFTLGCIAARQSAVDRFDVVLHVVGFTLFGGIVLHFKLMHWLITRMGIKTWSLILAALALANSSFAAEPSSVPQAATSGRYITLDAGSSADGVYSLIVSVSGGKVSVVGLSPVMTMTGTGQPIPPIADDPDEPDDPEPEEPEPDDPGDNPGDRNDVHFEAWVKSHESLVPTDTKNRVLIARGLALAYRSTADLIESEKITTIEQVDETQADLNANIIKTFGNQDDWQAFGKALSAEMDSRSAAGKLPTAKSYWSMSLAIADGLETWGADQALAIDFHELLNQIIQLIIQILLRRFGA